MSKSRSSREWTRRQRSVMTTEKRRYMEIAKKIKAALEAGKITEEEAEKKYLAVRQEIFGTPPSDKSEAKKRREGVEYRIREIEQLVKEDKVSREEGAKLIRETKKALDDTKGHNDKPRNRAEVVEYRVKEIEKAVAAGKLTREEGAQLIKDDSGLAEEK